MSAMPFQPVDGERARWRILYEDLFAGAEPGDLITYQEMGDLLDLDADDLAQRRVIQTVVRRVSTELAKDRRALEAVVGQGYRIRQPAGHIELARDHQARSSRSLARGQTAVERVDLSGLTPAQARLIELMSAAFSAQRSFNRSLDVRQRRLEQAVGALSNKGERTDEQVAELRQRLVDLEARIEKLRREP